MPETRVHGPARLPATAKAKARGDADAMRTVYDTGLPFSRTDARNAIPPFLRILVVENNGFLAVELADLLGELGHTVIGPAATVDAALAMAEETKIDLAIIDLELDRGGFGGDVVEVLLRRQGVRSIVVSGRLTGRNLEAALSLDLEGMLRKPFDPVTLRVLLRRFGRRMMAGSTHGDAPPGMTPVR